MIETVFNAVKPDDERLQYLRETIRRYGSRHRDLSAVKGPGGLGACTRPIFGWATTPCVAVVSSTEAVMNRQIRTTILEWNSRERDVLLRMIPAMFYRVQIGKIHARFKI